MKKIFGYAVAALLAGAVFAPGLARASCASLWYERNQIYKDAGYCFKTTRAIRAFGNSGCSFDDLNDVPLSARQRAAVNDIVAQERRMGCGN
ncbi:MAG: YARHG domain-containing protein [Methylocystis sp.]|nr:MAG: YARHG domain-containing protein [Methylocystis sp.]